MAESWFSLSREDQVEALEFAAASDITPHAQHQPSGNSGLLSVMSLPTTCHGNVVAFGDFCDMTGG